MSIYQIIPGTAIPRERSQLFSYRGPANIAPGTLVEIPLGRKTSYGVVWEVKNSATPSSLKSIQRIVQENFLTPEDRALLSWTATYYAAPLTQCFRLFLVPRMATPKGTGAHTKQVTIAKPIAPPAILGSMIRKPQTPALIIDEGEERKFTLYRAIITLTQKRTARAKILILCPENYHAQAIEKQLGALPGVIIGTRSAIFQDLTDLGAIIVDSEHNAHFKNEEQSPHYDARTLATFVAMRRKIPLFFESSTPRTTTYYYAKKDAWPILRHATKKTITPLIIDIRGTRSHFAPLTEDVVAVLGQALARDEKILCYVPRRGLARSLYCADCRHIFQCPNCTLPLAVHTARKLLCHHCGFSAESPTQCPQCASTRLQTQGAGVERLAQLLLQLFPKTPIVHIDAVATKTATTLRAAVKKLSSPGAAIAIGTDRILRPLGLPEFDLGIVVAADGLLFLPDFSASEQLFATISTLRRMLRNHAQLLCLTAFPENTTLQEAIAGKFEPFFRRELIARKQLSYPPFVQLVTFTRPFKSKSAAALMPGAQGPIRIPQRGERYILKRPKTGREPLPPLPGWWVDVDPVSLLH